MVGVEGNFFESGWSIWLENGVLSIYVCLSVCLPVCLSVCMDGWFATIEIIEIYSTI